MIPAREALAIRTRLLTRPRTGVRARHGAASARPGCMRFPARTRTRFRARARAWEVLHADKDDSDEKNRIEMHGMTRTT